MSGRLLVVGDRRVLELGARFTVDLTYGLNTGYHYDQRELRRCVARMSQGARVLDVVRAHAGADLLYARVDLLPTPEGPVLVELEVTEPSLYLQYDQTAADRFARAIAARVAAS